MLGIVVEDQLAYPTRRVEQQISHQRGPAGLVHGSQAGAVVAVEVLVEQQVVFPSWVGLHPFDASVDRPPAIQAGESNADQPIGKIPGNITQRQLLARSGWIFDREFRAKKLVILQERSNHQIIDREPAPQYGTPGCPTRPPTQAPQRLDGAE